MKNSACESWHRCWNDESDEEYKGINLKKVTGVYEMKKQLFLCDYCDFKSSKMEIVTDHFKAGHITTTELNAGSVTRKS